MRARIAGSERALTAGDTLEIPQSTAHAMWNQGEAEARRIWQTRPALRTEDFFVAVGRLAQRGS